VECATKNSEDCCLVTMRYSPCDNTPSAAIVAVTSRGVALLICKNIFVFSLLPLAVQANFIFHGEKLN
jgi:hypothetical protein